MRGFPFLCSARISIEKVIGPCKSENREFKLSKNLSIYESVVCEDCRELTLPFLVTVCASTSWKTPV